MPPEHDRAVGLRWGEAAALRVSDVDFLRRRIHLHRNAVTVGKQTWLGTLKSGKNRTVALPGFVTDALAQTCKGKQRTRAPTAGMTRSVEVIARFRNLVPRVVQPPRRRACPDATPFVTAALLV